MHWIILPCRQGMIDSVKSNPSIYIKGDRMQIDKMWWQCSGGGTIGRINCIGTEHKQKVELMHKCESECTSQRLLQLGFTTHSKALCFYCLLLICIFTPNCPQSKDFFSIIVLLPQNSTQHLSSDHDGGFQALLRCTKVIWACCDICM